MEERPWYVIWVQALITLSQTWHLALKNSQHVSTITEGGKEPEGVLKRAGPERETNRSVPEARPSATRRAPQAPPKLFQAKGKEQRATDRCRRDRLNRHFWNQSKMSEHKGTAVFSSVCFSSILVFPPAPLLGSVGAFWPAWWFCAHTFNFTLQLTPKRDKNVNYEQLGATAQSEAVKSSFTDKCCRETQRHSAKRWPCTSSLQSAASNPLLCDIEVGVFLQEFCKIRGLNDWSWG